MAIPHFPCVVGEESVAGCGLWQGYRSRSVMVGEGQHDGHDLNGYDRHSRQTVKTRNVTRFPGFKMRFVDPFKAP
jgi:hypothetical protein